MHVIGGTASTALAERISRELSNAPFGIPFTKRFPDGEMYVRVGGRLEGEDVVIVQSTRTDADLLELILLEDAVREAGAGHVFVVVPYFGYARQDRKFFPGEPVSARTLCRHVELDADAVVTVDLHSPADPRPVHETRLRGERDPRDRPSTSGATPGRPGLARQGRGRTRSPDGDHSSRNHGSPSTRSGSTASMSS